eukprot:COSAG01_NODE_19032_length_1035_cov_1.363248_1_plen_205_part_10
MHVPQGLLLLFWGWRLTGGVLFGMGFAVGSALAFALVSTLLSWFDANDGTIACWVFTFLVLGAGVATGFFVRQHAKACFFVLGAGVGGVLGYYIYSMLHVLFELLVLLPALLGGCAGLYWQQRILILASAAVGAFMVVLGLTYLVRPPLPFLLSLPVCQLLVPTLIGRASMRSHAGTGADRCGLRLLAHPNHVSAPFPSLRELC